MHNVSSSCVGVVLPSAVERKELLQFPVTREVANHTVAIANIDYWYYIITYSSCIDCMMKGSHFCMIEQYNLSRY